MSKSRAALMFALCVALAWAPSANAKKKKPQKSADSAAATPGDLSLDRSSIALPQASQSQIQAPAINTDKSLKLVKPPKTNQFYEGNAKEQEYEKLLDDEIGNLYELSQQYRKSANRGEIWLRLAERYVEKAKLIDSRKQADYDRQVKLFNDKKTSKKPVLELRLAKEYNQKAVELYDWFLRDFPKDPKVDQALFFLGYNTFELGQTQRGENYYRRLVREFPSSEYVHESNFALGEFYFENEVWDKALVHYDKVVQSKKARLYTFALYKMAWCHFRLGRTALALQEMEKVIRQSGGPQESKEEQGAGKAVNKVRLAGEALKDYVPFYAESGEYKNALNAFRRVVDNNEDKANTMMERLAYTYEDAGNRPASTYLFKQLIAKNPLAEKAADYQYQIIATYVTADAKVFRDELILWVENFGPGTSWAKQNAKNTKLVDDTAKLQETTLRNHVLQVHQNAQNSKAGYSQEQANTGYAFYAKYFQGSSHAAEMNFFHAELLFDMRKYEEAGKYYTLVTESAPHDSPYYQKAVINNLLALEKQLPSAAEIDGKRGKSLDSIAFDGAVDRFEKAALKFIQTFPKGDKTPDIRRRLGVLYYSYNHFDQAMAIFDSLVKESPDSGNGEIAGNLILDTYKLKNDMGGLADRAKKMLQDPVIARSKFGAKLREVSEAASFGRADKFAISKDYAKAAKEYESFAGEAKNAELRIAARYKAADNYEKAGDIQNSVRMHGAVIGTPATDAKMKTVQSDSRNALARLYQQMGQLELAAKQYASYGRENIKDAKGLAAVFNAAILFDATGDYPEAISQYELYQNTSKKADRNELLYAEAEIYRKQEKYKQAIGYYEKYIKQGAKDELIVKSAHQIAEIHKREGNQSLYRNDLKRIIEIQKKYRGKSNAGIAYAAEARFFFAQEKLAEFKTLKFTDNPKQQEKTAKQIISLQNQYVKQEMAEVIKMDFGPMIVAAFTSTGQMFEIIAQVFAGIPPGKDFSADDKKRLQDMIQGQVNTYLSQAKDSYKLAITKAAELELVTEWSKTAQSALFQIEPGNPLAGIEYTDETPTVGWGIQ